MRTRTARAAALVATLAAVVFLFGWWGPARSSTSDTTAHWPTSTRITAGHAAVVSGTSSGGDRTVHLQYRALGGWRTVARTTVDSAGHYRLRIPTNWLGTRTYRVLRANDASGTRQLTVRPAYTPRGRSSQYRFLNSSMARWDPCSVIGYRVSGRIPSGAIGDVRRAFRTIGQATGYRFVYRGRAARIPQYDGNTWYPSDTQMVIGWATPSQTSLLRQYPRAAGVGGSVSRGGFVNGDGTRVTRIVRGMVAVNRHVRLRGGFGSGVSRGDLLLHELGHTMGLGHSGSPKQLMYPTLTRSKARFGRGDLHGLERRGARLGCLRVQSGRTGTGGAETLDLAP